MNLLVIDGDTMRFIIVATVVVGFFVYARWHLSAGGTLTAGYLIILALLGEWVVILSIAVVAGVSAYVVRTWLIRYLALPRAWIFVALVAMGALTMSALTLASRWLGPVALPGGFELVLLVGSFITPGLIAYDYVHQGPLPTLMGLGLTLVGTSIIVVPIIWLADLLQPESTTPVVFGFGEIPAGLYGLATLACIFFSGALRLSFGVRTGGFVGALFITQLLSLAAFVTIFTATIAAHLVTRFIRSRVTLSPRQEFHIAMLLGMMAAWTGLYWASAVGWVPALAANAYALQPLLAVGLLAADMTRVNSSIATTLGGASLTVGFIVLVIYVATGSGPIMWVTTPLLIVSVPLILAVPGAVALRRSWRDSVATGRQVAQSVTSLDEREG